jgi:hypothetical protein
VFMASDNPGCTSTAIWGRCGLFVRVASNRLRIDAVRRSTSPEGED